ncbi:thymidylate synthase [Paenibacillus sp. FSL M7-0802]|uniref:thymidylate synthase n=1 Tax=Paenibacillus sp. FSL M7-0802 TaxID=2921536 RepID=UPI0030FA69A3
MSSVDNQYLALVRDILENGYEDTNRTADRSKKVFGKVLRFNLAEEFPLLTLKFTGYKTLTKEMLWIYQQGSNDVQWLNDRGIKIWDEWKLPDGTIGEAYGAQIKKHNQINKLINELKNNPQSRRMVIDLWAVADLDKMSLTPCMFNHIADVNDGKLNWHTTIRSSDVALGLPYNIAQTAILVHMIAQVAGLQVGELMIAITNAHLYEQHYEPIKEIFNRTSYPAPKLWLDPTVTDFHEFDVDKHVKMLDYQSHPSIKMRVSV